MAERIRDALEYKQRAEEETARGEAAEKDSEASKIELVAKTGKMRDLESQINALTKSLREKEREVNSAQSNLKDELTRLTEEKLRLEDELREKDTATSSKFGTLEYKLRLAAAEKSDFELILTRVYASMQNPRMQRVVGEMLKVQKELHAALREKAEMELASPPELELTPAYVQLKAKIGTPSLLILRGIDELKKKLEGFGGELREMEGKSARTVAAAETPVPSAGRNSAAAAANSSNPKSETEKKRESPAPVSQRTSRLTGTLPKQGNEDFVETLAKVQWGGNIISRSRCRWRSTGRSRL